MVPLNPFPDFSYIPLNLTSGMPCSPSRHKAVTCTGIRLIPVGNGSGTTRGIPEKILHRIRQGRKPENILTLTFSDKDAYGMPERSEKQTNTRDPAISHVLRLRPPGAAGQCARFRPFVFWPGSSAGSTSLCGGKQISASLNFSQMLCTAALPAFMNSTGNNRLTDIAFFLIIPSESQK